MLRLLKGIVGFTLGIVLLAGARPSGKNGAGRPLQDEPGREIDRLFAPWDKPNSPGGVVAVFREGRTVYQKGYGMANLEWGIPNTPQTVFCIGSVSKQFTAYCIALLEADGKIRLEDEYRQYIPEMPDYGVRITLGDLVHHTSGIRDDQMLMYLGDWERGELHANQDIIEKVLSRQKGLLFSPGEAFDYSSANYALLAEIVRRVSGLSLREFARRNIFQPLGMARTFFMDNFRETVPNRAWSYVRGEDGSYLAYIDTYDQVGPGGVYTTVGDMALWNGNFDAPRAGGAGVARRILAPGRLKGGEAVPYAFGLELDTIRGLPVVKHDGSYGGYGAMFLRFPEENFAVFCAVNAGDLDARMICRRVADIYLRERFRESAVPAPTFIPMGTEKLEALAGAYRGAKNADLMVLEAGRDRLVGEINGGFRVEYAPVSPTEFRPATPGYPVALRFRKNDSGTRFEFETLLAGKPVQRFEPIELSAPTAEQLHLYEGRYHSEELSVTYAMEVKEGQLYVRFKRAPRSPLKALVRDQFAAWPLIFDFVRDRRGKVEGFRLGRIGPQGILFRRIPPESR